MDPQDVGKRRFSVRPIIPDTERIVLDLSDLTHMDSMRLGSVMRRCVSAKSAGCDQEIINFGERIRKMLSTTHLLSILAVINQQRIAMICALESPRLTRLL
jgi:anti-anti-sigma factor